MVERTIDARLGRIGVVMMSAVGDAVHVLPVLNAIKRHSPSSHVTWVLQPGPATEQPRTAYREPDPQDGGSRQQRPVAVGRKVSREEDDPERPGAEADESLDPTRRDDQYREPRCADHASRSGELGGHGLTTTTALETWPLAATTRR